jgi:ribonucleoside-diphosphate reductase alpha chain
MNTMTEQEWLNDNQLSLDIWNNKYRHDNESFDQWLVRVSGGDAEIARLIKEKKFLFGGRTLANRGIEGAGSYSNCYSIGFVPDSLEGIMDVASKIALTFKAQGGQGLSLSKIRPKGSLIRGQFKSDGIVPFMHIFNTVTESISQGGSRKGRL